MNDLDVTHVHDDERRTMELARVERVDGLAVEHYECTCGHRVVVLDQVEGEEQGSSWPIHWIVEPGETHG